ncbi:MAG: transposase domain-containing protein [Magnetospiraceae bacterium]
MKQWFTAQEIAEARLPGMPAVKRAVNALAAREGWAERIDPTAGPLARPRAGRGGGMEYHLSLLPSEARIALLAQVDMETATGPSDHGRSDLWTWFDKQTDKKKQTARVRLGLIRKVQALHRSGMLKNFAAATVAAEAGVSVGSIYGWERACRALPESDWLPALAPGHTGRRKTAEMSDGAWEAFKTDYLRPEQPNMESCYRRVTSAGSDKGWIIPCLKTFQRRLEREFSPAVVVLAREGIDALKRMYPAQDRDRSVFHALEAVNADGHRWDVFCRWPDGEIARPMMVAIQDLYSGKILSWRIDRSENSHSVRLAFGDLIETYGIPKSAYLDNGRGFAAKMLTGGTKTRFRFRVRPEDPDGILTQLGVDIVWTTPYSGQSKPIERAFRDLCADIAKHPALAGAYTGNRPDAKPENYASRAVDIEEFLGIVESGITEHNARPGRRGGVCAGRSFDQVFAESYGCAPIQQATEEQYRLWLLAAEGVTPRKPDGAIHLMGNRFWGEFLHGHISGKVVARFDPQNLHVGLHVYGLDGRYLGFADVIEAVGFNDLQAAKDHARERRRWMRAQRDMLKAERQMGIAELASMLPETGPAPLPETKIVSLPRNIPAAAMQKPSAEPVPLTEEEQAAADAAFAAMSGANVTPFPAPEASAEVPESFDSDEAFARWAMAHPEALDRRQEVYLATLLENRSFRMLLGIAEEEKSHAG